VHRTIAAASLILALAACAALVSGCLPSTTTLTPDDDGRELRMGVGDRIVVVLGSNPATGFMWQAGDYDRDVLQQTGDVEYEPSASVPGASGTDTLTFEAVGEGETTLELIYRRPWEKSRQPAERFTVHVEVR
jgi:predicted secreted protein